MKRAIFAMMVAAGLAASTGCQTLGNQGGGLSCGGGCEDGSCGQAGCQDGQAGCENCQGKAAHPRLEALKRHMQGDPQMMDAGPASAAITYPYYTTRGPRDFFEPNPPTIGR